MLSVVLFTLLALACLAVVHAAPALAATADISVSADNPPPPAAPAGQASTYTINFTCSAVSANSCGGDPTITIPLDVTSTNLNTPDPATWAYSSLSTIPGLVTSTQVANGNIVITLNAAALQAGQSDTVQLSVTPPNNITPDATTWQIEPSFQTDEIDSVSAPTPALGAATAASKPALTKVTSDGGAVYVAGNNVIFNLTAKCNTTGSTGNLYYTQGSLVDTLPAGLTFVSATPAPTTAPNVGNAGAITWNYPTPASLPVGCGQGAGATQSYTVVAQIPAGTTNGLSLTNTATFGGLPIDQTTLQTTTATRAVTAITNPPASPGTFISKTALGPLSIPVRGFDATYAGNWITPIATQPSTSPGSAEAMYTVTIGYPASRAFTTDLADPVPCLTNLTGVTYSSNTPTSGAINGVGSINNLCPSPAFNPTAVRVNSASLAAAVAGGWTPIGIRTDGGTFPLVRVGAIGTSTYFDVPTAQLTHVAAIELPQNANLTDVMMSMNVWGYADASLVGGNLVNDIATATAYPTGGPGTPVTASQAAYVAIQPAQTQLGVFKAFGILNAAPGQTTALNLTGSVQTAAGVPGNVVMTDLLPAGLSWANPSASANFSVTKGRGGSAVQVAGTLQNTPNFNSTGQELIRITLPASAFTAGYYTITAPTNLIDLTVPAGAGTYNNTAQLFVHGIGQNTLSTCGPGTTTVQATFESSDPLDLDGDGATNENYCQWAASLTVPPSGPPAFSVVKSVQGDQDVAPKFSPGIGDAAQGGSGTYTLTWTSTGGSSLSNPVIYDILPHVGDTGVSQGQSTVARDSQYAPTFASITGTLPSGVAVAYSTSTNPCRPEVFPNTSNPSCVDNWSATVPADPTTVKALRFTATGAYAPAASFAVSFTVNVPPQFVNVVAWNSAAADAVVTSSGAALLPAEGPKVGLTAPAAPLLPTLATSTSAPSVAPGGPFSDAVDVANTGGAGGTLAWQLVGPVAPDANGTCDNADWSGAATLDTGTIAVAGDGTYSTAADAPTTAGCYSYAETLTGGAWSAAVTSAAGTPGETVLVRPATFTTTASAVRMLPGDTVTDSVALAGTGTNPGTGSIAWTLVGPVAPAADGTCNNLNWAAAPTSDRGTIPITGDGTYQTGSSAPTATGCYSYVDSLLAPYPGAPAGSLAGAVGETVLVAVPSLATTISSASVLTGDQVDDSIVVHGTGGQPGSLAWTLLGPVAPAAGGGCAGISWAGATTAAQGTLAVTGDGPDTTPAATLSDAGCYSYQVTLSGASYGPEVTSAAGVSGEVAEATAPTAPTVPAAGRPNVDLTVTKRADEQTATFGTPVTYTLTVENHGSDTATAVMVTDTPVTNLRLVSARSADGSCGHSFPLVCTLRDLQGHHQSTVTVVAVPLTAGVVDNGVHVTTAEPNIAPPKSVVSHAHTKVLATLELAKRAQVRSVHAGDLARFVITVTNPMSAAARHASVCDRLPRGLVFASASVKTTMSMGTVCWTIAAIAPHAHRQATIVVRALGGSSGRLVNHATLSGPMTRSRRAHAVISVLPRPPKPTPVTG